MSIVNLIASNSAAAIALVKQYVGNPTIGFNGVFVPIQCYRYVPRISAAVSKKILIDTTGKRQATDNVAPGTHEWHMEGYIGGLPFELSSLFMPSIANFRDTLDNAFLSRLPLDFYDADQKAWTNANGHPVLIEDLEFEKLHDTENRLTVRISLREINFLTVTINTTTPQDPVTAAATPASGTSTGAPSQNGAQEAVAENTPAAPSSSWGTETFQMVAGLR
jgi:hypothetical protein